MAGKPQPVAPRFWAKVKVTEYCWLWTGALRNGYGRFGSPPYRYAHRVAWELTNGSPGDLKVLHKCDNPKCVRPDHLFLGTQRDNIRDRAQKGRTAVLSTEHYKRIGHIGGKRRWGREPGGITITEI
jgi:hypothetical protein